MRTFIETIRIWNAIVDVDPWALYQHSFSADAKPDLIFTR